MKRYGPIALIICFITIIYATGILENITLQSVKDNRIALLHYVSENYVLSVVLFALVYIATVSLSLPFASLLTLLGGFLFGVFYGSVLIVLSATIGATIVFCVAKTTLGSTLRDKAGPFYNKVALNMKENAFQYMLFMRFVPVVPFFIANILPALFDIKLRDYFISTFIGIIPGTVVYANLGRELGTIETLSDLISTQTLLAFGFLGVLSLVPTLIKNFKQSEKLT